MKFTIRRTEHVSWTVGELGKIEKTNAKGPRLGNKNGNFGR